MSSDDLVERLRKRDDVIHTCGHRGARGVMPENTLEGFEYTFASGIKVVELDVLATADLVPVITHDPKLNPLITRDAAGKWLEEGNHLVYQLTFEELQKYDVGAVKPGTWYADRFPEQRTINPARIPSLASLCDLVLKAEYQDCKLIVEIKSNPNHPEWTPELPQYVECILRPLIDRNLHERIALHSFDWRVLQECKRQAPDIVRSYLTHVEAIGSNLFANVFEGSPWMGDINLGYFAGGLPWLIAASGGKFWSPWHLDLSAQDLATAHKLGLVVYVWTLNKSEEIIRAINLGVDGIVTDYPDRVNALLKERGLSWQLPGE